MNMITIEEITLFEDSAASITATPDGLDFNVDDLGYSIVVPWQIVKGLVEAYRP